MKSSTSIVYVQFQSLHGDQRGSQLLFKFFLWGAQQPARMVFGSTLDCSEATKRPLWLLDTCRPLPPPLFPIVSLHLSPPTRKKNYPLFVLHRWSIHHLPSLFSPRWSAGPGFRLLDVPGWTQVFGGRISWLLMVVWINGQHPVICLGNLTLWAIVFVICHQARVSNPTARWPLPLCIQETKVNKKVQYYIQQRTKFSLQL